MLTAPSPAANKAWTSVETMPGSIYAAAAVGQPAITMATMAILRVICQPVPVRIESARP